ncbi:MAG: PBP1A family penicillin-binding protein [Pseudomonadota bacterium]
MLRKVLRLVWLVTWRIAVVIAAIIAASTTYYYLDLPPVTELLDGRDRGSVTLLDRDGEVFAWRGAQYGGTVHAEEMSPHLLNAVIATEDRRYYHHPGIDPIGIARAMVANVRAGRLVQGGSTITQQVAKLVFVGPARTLERKLREIPIALAMELRYSKEEILSIYLNRAYLGAGTYGFEAAAQRYFGRSARVVGPAEAAMLAGLLKAPSRYAPTSDITLARERAATIVALMADQGLLTPEQVVEAEANPASLSTAASARAGGYFADWVMEAGPDFLTTATSEDVEILTTFDPEIQRAAEEALDHVFETRVREGSEAEAAIVILSRDGAVRAIVGGRRRGTAGQFNRATQALRQTGSAFKPVVYAAALDQGLLPDTLVEDAPITLTIPGSGRWSPENYGGGYRGHISLREALAHSVNTAAVRVSEEVGRENVQAMARALGISSDLADGPAIALGVSEATLLEMTGVYATFLNEGVTAAPFGYHAIQLRGDATPLFGSDAEAGTRALDADLAGYLTGMLAEVVATGTGRRARLPDGRPAAGKTGTTQGARDAWFVGFTGQYVAGVWMGYDDNRQLTGVTGGGLPAQIWQETMVRIHEGAPILPLPIRQPPPGSGLRLAGDVGRGGETESLIESVIQGILGGSSSNVERERGKPADADR